MKSRIWRGAGVVIVLLLAIIAVARAQSSPLKWNGLSYTSTGVSFANLATTPPQTSGTMVYCPNCTQTTVCAAGGTGAMAKLVAGVWKCTDTTVTGSVTDPLLLNKLTGTGAAPAVSGYSVNGLVNVQAYGASGAGPNVTTGTINASSNSLAVGSAAGWSAGMPIIVSHAGAASGLSTPGAPTVTNVGTAGATSYSYVCAEMDSAHGFTAKGAAGTTATGNASLSGANYNRIACPDTPGAGQLNLIYQTAPSAYLVAITSGTNAADIGFSFNGLASGFYGLTFWDVPTTAPAAAAADWLSTTVSSINGTTLTLGATATTNATSQAVSHNDTTAFTNAFATGSPMLVPAGNYFFCGTALNGGNIGLVADHNDSVSIAMCPGQALFQPTSPPFGVNIRNITFLGGASVLYVTSAAAQTSFAYSHNISDNIFWWYSGAEIATDSTDQPAWKIDHNNLLALDDTSSIGVLIPGASGSQIINNNFGAGRIDIKMTSGAANLVSGNTFEETQGLANPQKPRIDIWLTGGWNAGPWILANKFGNEGLDTDDLHILYADDDATSGTDEATFMPKLKSANDANAATTGTTISSSAQCPFVVGDVGSTITIRGAGAGGFDLTSTIVGFVNSCQITIGVTPSTNINGTVIHWAPASTNALVGLNVSRNYINGIGSNGQSPPLLYSTSKAISDSMIDHNLSIGGLFQLIGFAEIAPIISSPLAGNIVGPNTAALTIPAANQAGFATLVLPDGGGTNPTVTSCGTGSVTAGSTNAAGSATATGATACTVTFSTSNGGWFNAPNCSVTDYTTAAGLKITAPTTANFTVSGLTSGDAFGWTCIGN